MLQTLRCDPLDWPEDAFDEPVAQSLRGSLGTSRGGEQSHRSNALDHIYEPSEHMESSLDEPAVHHCQLHQSKWREKLRSEQEQDPNCGIPVDALHISCAPPLRPDFLFGWGKCFDLEVARPSRTPTPCAPLQVSTRNCARSTPRELLCTPGKVVTTSFDDGRPKRLNQSSSSGWVSPIPPKANIDEDVEACTANGDAKSCGLAPPTPRSTRQHDDSQPSSSRGPSDLVALPRHHMPSLPKELPDLAFTIPPEARPCDESSPCDLSPMEAASRHAKEIYMDWGRCSKSTSPTFEHLLSLLPLLPLMLFIAILIYRLPFLVSGIRLGRGWFTTWTQFFFVLLELPMVVVCVLAPWRLVFIIRDSPCTKTNLDCTWLVGFHAYSASLDMLALLGFVVLSLLSPHRLCRKIFRVSLQKSYTLSCATVKHECMGEPWHCDPRVRIPQNSSTVTAYHGTSRQNASAIRKFGFIPSQDGMLGPGVYLSRDISKAASYGDGTIVWLRASVGRIIVFSQKNHPDQRNWSSKGFDTAFVPAGNHVVASRREELCVADPANIVVLGTLWTHTLFPQVLILRQVYEMICDVALLLFVYRLVFVIRVMCEEGSTFRDVEETWAQQRQLLVKDLYTFLFCPCFVIFWLLLVYVSLKLFTAVMP